MNEQDDGTSTKFLGIPISEAILIATASGAAYVLAFAYQAGYCDAFGIPLQLITLNVVDVLRAAVQILIVVAFILGLLNFLSSLLPSRMPNSLRRGLLQAIPLLIISFPYLFFYEWGAMAEMLSILMALVAMAIFLPLLLARWNKNYKERLEAMEDRASPGSLWDGSLLNRAVKVAGLRLFTAALYFLLGAYLAYNTGKASAIKQKTFFLKNGSLDEVVLFMTTERLVSAPVNEITKGIEPVFTITNLAEETVTLRPVEIGPLTLYGSTGAQAKAPREPLAPPVKPPAVDGYERPSVPSPTDKRSGPT